MDAEFVEDGGYYLVKYKGLRTYAKIVGLIDEMEANAAQTGVYKYLFDLRESEEGFTLSDKYNLGTHLAKVFGIKYTVAVLNRKDQITGFLENVSLNRGALKFVITDNEDVARKHLR